MSYFTEKVDQLIQDKGITRNKMLKDLDLGKNSMVNWSMREDILPNGNTLIKLADYFDISIDELVGRNKKCSKT